MIKKPDDKSRNIIATIIITGIGIKFFEITMESILMENNSMLIINYISPIIILIDYSFSIIYKYKFDKRKVRK